jgi:HEAT repeat protein
MADKNRDVRREAASVLGSLGEQKALVFIERALAHKDVRMRRAAVCALGSAASSLSFADGEKARVLLRTALADEDADVRGHAALAILRVVEPDPAAILLSRTLRDPDTGVRTYAVTALGNSTLTAREIFELLRKALGDGKHQVRRAVVRQLQFTGGQEAVTLIGRALDDSNYGVRCEAAWALGNLNGARARDLLLSRLAKEQNRTVIRTITDVLRRDFPGDPGVEKELKDLGRGKRPEVF